MSRNICHFHFISDKYLRKLVYRFVLILLNTDAIPEEVTFSAGGGVESTTRDN